MVESRELRSVYTELLMESAKADKRIVAMDCDLMVANNLIVMRDQMPEQVIDAGIAESNMIGVASGLSSMGLIPFCHTFCVFASRRCYDQAFLSVAYAGLNVKIVGTDPGIAAEQNGGTHMSFEDAGIMRNIPEMMVVEPVDEAHLRSIFPQIRDHYGPVYMRLFRKPPEHVYEPGTVFTLGKSHRLRDGADATVFASGIMVHRAMEAAAALEKEGISLRVENMHTWKPLDQEAVIAAAKETGAIISAENHSLINGLGSAIAQVLVQNVPVPMEMVGVRDQFGQVGKMPFLSDYYHLNTEDIIAAARAAVARK